MYNTVCAWVDLDGCGTDRAEGFSGKGFSGKAFAERLLRNGFREVGDIRVPSSAAEKAPPPRTDEVCRQRHTSVGACTVIG